MSYSRIALLAILETKHKTHCSLPKGQGPDEQGSHQMALDVNNILTWLLPTPVYLKILFNSLLKGYGAQVDIAGYHKVYHDARYSFSYDFPRYAIDNTVHFSGPLYFFDLLLAMRCYVCSVKNSKDEINVLSIKKLWKIVATPAGKPSSLWSNDSKFWEFCC